MVVVHVDVGSLSKGGVRPPVVSPESYVTQLVAELGPEGFSRMCCIARSMSRISVCSHGRDSDSGASLAVRNAWGLSLGTQVEARGAGGSWMVVVHVDVGSLSKGGVRPPVVSPESYVTQLVAELGPEGFMRMCCIARSMSRISV
jgi:hypothetical protein